MGCEHGHGAAWRCETFSAAYVPARPALASQRRAARNAGAPGDRWKTVINRPSVRPWRKRGDHIVIMGQVRGDAALQGLMQVLRLRAH